MALKEKIYELLKNNNSMTQSSIAYSIYGDKNHSSNIYGALTNLVNEGMILKIGENPAYYCFGNIPIENVIKVNKEKNKYRDVSNDIINNNTLNEAEEIVAKSDIYGVESDLIQRCLKRFPNNDDIDIVAMKMGLIDITNSTHLSQHKNRINVVDLAKIIVGITDIDHRIAEGDPEVVNEIARSNGNINLFSFASKYCCYHNVFVYGRDDYSILDTVLKDYLPLYFNDIKKSQIQYWQNNFKYGDYNIYITKKLDELEINVKYRKRKFDHYIWYKNRNWKQIGNNLISL